MKKLLVVLSLSMAAFSFQASAATFTLTDIANVHTGTNSISDTHAVTGSINTGWSFESTNTGTGAFAVELNPNNFGHPLFAVKVYDSLLNVVFNSGIANSLDKAFTLSFLANSPLFIEVIGSTSASGQLSVSVNAVPVPAAVWLFGSALMGLTGIKRRKSVLA